MRQDLASCPWPVGCGIIAVSMEKGGAAVKKRRAALLALAILFVLLGVMNGGAGDVLMKAIAVCTECIGLG